MNTYPSRYARVVTLGTFAGTPFVGSYDVENHVECPDALPPAESRLALWEVAKVWMGTGGRPLRASLRLIRELRWRRAVKASGAAA